MTILCLVINRMTALWNGSQNFDYCHLTRSRLVLFLQSQSAGSCQEIESMTSQRDFFYMTNENEDWEYEGALPMFDTTTLTNSVGVPYCYYVPYGKFYRKIECVVQVNCNYWFLMDIYLNLELFQNIKCFVSMCNLNFGGFTFNVLTNVHKMSLFHAFYILTGNDFVEDLELWIILKYLQ